MEDFPIAYLNSNDGSGLIAFGDGPTIKHNSGNALKALDKFLKEYEGKYIFGYLSYDIKNEIEVLESKNVDELGFPELYFWVPKWLVKMSNENYEFLQGEPDALSYQFLNNFLEEETDQNFHPYAIDFKARTSKSTYIQNVEKIKEHLQKGEYYELNYCQEFYAENVELKNSIDTYFKLNKLTKAPFSSFIQFEHFSVFGGSPERFLRKVGTKLISQPIKGTNERLKGESENKAQRELLKSDKKEQAENVMIVDLVRNDFSKIADRNTVNVEELCEIYTFEYVNQMISTIACEVAEDIKFIDIVKATFPMGSMTGAPKISAMKHIEELEDFKRGVYSGTIGYIKPNRDFDFNVVIRSLLYNSEKKYLSCAVGGAITINSEAEKEYDECLVKVGRILNGMNEAI